MKHLIRRISSSKYKVLAHFKIDDLTMNIISKEGSMSIVMNGHEIFYAPIIEESTKNLRHILPDIFLDVVKEAKSGNTEIYRDKVSNVLQNSILSNLLKDIKCDDVNVIIKKMPKDISNIRQTLTSEFIPHKAFNFEYLVRNLVVLNKKVAFICSLLSNVYNKSIMLTRKKLVKTMWGAEDTQKIIDSIKNKLIEEEEYWNKTYLCRELVQKTINRLCQKFKSNLLYNCEEEKKYVAAVLIPDIICEYENLKKLLMHAIMVIAPLAYIDEIFRDNTTYPASFFIDSNLLNNLKNDYDNIIKFLSEIPAIESRVIDPLDFVKVSFLNKK